MPVEGISGSAPVHATQSDTDKAKLADDLNKFLTLLITQLQNQDPLDPLDANEFTSQLVQFASVEQQIHQNSNLEALLAVEQTSQAAAMVNYLGTTIEATGNEVSLTGGEARMTYSLSENVDETTIAVIDATGKVVTIASGAAEAGRHEFTWDGRDSGGNPVADGVYSIEVSPQRADGTFADVATTVFGTVTGAAVNDSIVQLSMGGISVEMADVLSVSDGPATTPQPSDED